MNQKRKDWASNYTTKKNRIEKKKQLLRKHQTEKPLSLEKKLGQIKTLVESYI